MIKASCGTSPIRLWPPDWTTKRGAGDEYASKWSVMMGIGVMFSLKGQYIAAALGRRYDGERNTSRRKHGRRHDNKSV